MGTAGDAGEHLSEAARVLRQHADLRARALASQAFRDWRRAYRELDVDGEQLYVRAGAPMSGGGDTLLDEDQLLLEWARQQDPARAPAEAAAVRAVFQGKTGR